MLKDNMGATLRFATGRAGRASPLSRSASQPKVLVPDAATAKIRLFINYEHIALVMKVRRELGIGEGIAA